MKRKTENRFSYDRDNTYIYILNYPYPSKPWKTEHCPEIMNFYAGDILLWLGRISVFCTSCLIGKQPQGILRASKRCYKNFLFKIWSNMNHLKLSIIFEHFRIQSRRILSTKFESNKQKLGIKISYLKIPGITMG